MANEKDNAPERVWINSLPESGRVTAYVSPIREVGSGRSLSLAEYVRADLATPASAAPVVDDNDAEPLTDAEVDALLEAHKNDPVDPAQVNRVEWLFRKKLAASVIDKATERLRSYDERIAQGGKGAQDMERLYGKEAAFHREVIRAVETLALEPRSAAAAPAPVEQSDSLLAQIATIADIGSAGEFGDALERLRAIRELAHRATGHDSPAEQSESAWHVCTVCKVGPVCPEEGFDTCLKCMKNI